FQPFMQDVSSGRAEQGTGLGLAIAKSLVQMMGGEIGCVGKPGQGSTFWFTIRVDAAGDATVGDAPGRDRARDSHAHVDPAPGRLIVAEDNPVNGMVTVALLEEAGCIVDVASTGREAVDACARQRYDLVLMDCRMPELDGYQAAQAIRRAEGDRAVHVPIVA